MKRSIILFAILWIMGIAANYAQEVSQEDALTVARNWIEYCHQSPSHKLNASHILYDDDDILAHCFELYPIGYIVITSRYQLPPVLAYSFSDSFDHPESDNNPLEEMIIYDLSGKIENIDETPQDVIMQNQDKWDELLNGKLKPPLFEQWPPEGSTTTGGWLETNWSQSAPYNNFCPMDPVNNARSVAGCPAVALAMIIHYQKELNGTQFDDGDDYYHSYAGRQYWIDDDSHTMDFPPFPGLNTYFDSIAARFPVYIPLTTEEIAALVFACGVAAQQVYTSEVSGTFGVDQAYQAYQRFGYSDALLIYDSDTSFYTLMKNNMKDGIPVHLALLVDGAGGGHNVVADGYNTDDYYHLNFGWGGSYNGWYLIPEGIPYNLTIVEGAIMDIGVSHVGIGTNKKSDEISLSVYPNPSQGTIYISFELQKPANTKIMICNQSGSVIDIIREEHMIKGQHKINHTPTLPSGVYHIVIETRDNLYTEELIIIN
jgi:hypothetical protein